MLAFWLSPSYAGEKYPVGTMPNNKPTQAVTPPRAYIREWREHLGITQPQLGEITGDGKDQISRWENGRRRLSVEKAMQIAVGMGLEPWRIFLDPREETVLLTGEEADFAKLILGLSPEDRALLLANALRLAQRDRS